MSLNFLENARFVKNAPRIFWFGMHTIVWFAMLIGRGLPEAINYFVGVILFSSLVIWYFEYAVLPIYLANDGKMNRRLITAICINLFLFAIGIGAHFIFRNLIWDRFGVERVIPLIVRIPLWIMIVVLGIAITASIQIAREYHMRAVQKIGQEADRAQAELKLLKTQISPHFLFNTLNNIYGLAYLKDDRAALMISKLSQIMRYLLDDCQQQEVFLAKERDLVENYLSLQLLKFKNPLNIDFYHAGIQNVNRITPMILINFVENCFKHSDLDNNPDGWIKITMEVENNALTFVTENSFRKEIQKVRDRKGIGLSNSLKLLEANYPEKHTVDIKETDGVYTLELRLKLG